MTVPKLPAFDSKGFAARLKEAIPKRPDGTPITVWDGFPPFIAGLRGLRDNVAAQAVQLADQKANLDAHTTRLNIHADRLAALEAQPPRPFP